MAPCPPLPLICTVAATAHENESVTRATAGKALEHHAVLLRCKSYRDGKLVGGCHQGTPFDTDCTSMKRSHEMNPIHLRKKTNRIGSATKKPHSLKSETSTTYLVDAFQSPVLDHLFRPTTKFFSGLEQQLDGTPKIGTTSCEHPSSDEEHRDMPYNSPPHEVRSTRDQSVNSRLQGVPHNGWLVGWGGGGRGG